MSSNPAYEEDGPEDAVEPPVHGSYKPRTDNDVTYSQIKQITAMPGRPGSSASSSVPDRTSNTPSKRTSDHERPPSKASSNKPAVSPAGDGRQSMPGYDQQSGSYAPSDRHAGPIPTKTPLGSGSVAESGPLHEEPPIPKKFTSTPHAFKYDGEKKTLEAVVDLAESLVPDKPYAGMGKEDLLRFSQTPFWNRFRMAFTILFWLVWLGLLGAVIGLTVTFPQCVPPPDMPWDETAVYYQIYVRSFFDSNGDGVGDLEGIRHKLPYLSEMQIDAIMLSSVYRSQNGSYPDYGYEVTNHKDIDPEYGTMADFDRLLAEAHEWDIRVIMDFIPNYTGTEHEWFVQSMSESDPTNPYWNYYVWTQCDTTPPDYINNWRTVYGEAAWSSGGARNGTDEQCYLHQFLNTQPELNLRSAVVQHELEDILRFWLDKGVDGFRTDKVMYLYEDADFRNDPDNGMCTPPDQSAYHCYDHIHTTSQDEIYPLVAKWRAIVDEYSQNTDQKRVLITDANTDANTTLMYYGKYGPDGAHFPLNYELTRTNMSQCGGKCVQRLVDDFLYGVPTYAAANWLTGTQDITRFADVFPATPDWGYQNAYSMLKLTMPGAAILYYGEEIGMTNVNKTGTDPRDPAGRPNNMFSRDPYRTPMQWTNEYPDAGFISENATDAEDPWLEVGDNLHNISIEVQNGTDHTPYEFHKAMIDLRNASRTFFVGSFQYTLLTDNIISYYRAYEGLNRYLVAINFGPDDEDANVAGSFYGIPNSADVAMTTRADQVQQTGGSAKLNDLHLRPGDGVVVTWPYVRPDGK